MICLRNVARGFASLVALTIGSLCVAGLTYAPDLTIPPDLEGRSLVVAGVPLRVLSEGRGRDVLMLHGSSGSLEDFALQAEALEPSFRVTRYDRPGHGFSGDTGLHSRTHNAELALALIETLALEQVVVVGHSYGGSTALALGLLRSPRVAAIVVVDSLIYPSAQPTSLLFRIASLPAFGTGLARVLPRAVLEDGVAEGLRAVFVAGPPPAGFVDLRRRIWANPKVIHALAREGVESEGELAMLAPHYGEIDVPVYFAVQRDAALRRDQADRLVRERPATIVERVADTGHYIQIERPEVITALIRRASEESARLVPREQNP